MERKNGAVVSIEIQTFTKAALEDSAIFTRGFAKDFGIVVVANQSMHRAPAMSIARPCYLEFSYVSFTTHQA